MAKFEDLTLNQIHSYCKRMHTYYNGDACDCCELHKDCHKWNFEGNADCVIYPYEWIKINEN